MLGVLLGLLVVGMGAPPPPNPFLGTWDVYWVGIKESATLRFTETGEVWDMVEPVSYLDRYTYTPTTLTFFGDTWVYFSADVNHIRLIGWHVDEQGQHIPALMLFDRVTLQEGNT